MGTGDREFKSHLSDHEIYRRVSIVVAMSALICYNIYIESEKNKPMRNPARIEKILKKLQAVWEQYPDMRLGQLILNVVGDPSLYYIEDQDLVDVIELFYNPKQ